MKKNILAAIAVTVLLLLVITSPAIYTFFTGDFPGASRFYGIQEDDQIVTAIFNARQIVGFVK